MGALLVLLVVVAVCVYAMFNPADLVGSFRQVWTLTREYPEEVLATVATLIAVTATLRFILKRPFRTVHALPSHVVTARLQRRVGREIGPALERSARHEAAHTLAAYLLGAAHLTADVHIFGDRDGRATYRHIEEATPWDDAYDDLVIGFAAQVIDHQHGHFDAGSMADMASQQRRMMVIISAGKQPSRHEGALTVEALIESTRAEAEQLLEQHPDELERITAALVEERELDDDEIRALIANQTPAIAA